MKFVYGKTLKKVIKEYYLRRPRDPLGRPA